VPILYIDEAIEAQRGRELAPGVPADEWPAGI
jgi:hypothetical protein